MISCENPQIIINPGVYEAVAFSHKVSVNGIIRYYNGVSRLFRRPLYSHLKEIKDTITQENYENYFTFDRFNNKIFLFLVVPCRHCVLCQQRDENEIAQRLQFEAECYPNEPYFVTLTFGSWSLPKDNNPTKRHIATFIKRLRNYTDELGYRIRFYAQGEHGKAKGRAHIHCLIFGLPDMPHNTAVNLFSKAWLTQKIYTHLVNGKLVKERLPIGHVDVHQINDPNYVAWYEFSHGRKINPSDGLRYCCKYSSKHSHCRTWSLGLGKQFAQKFINEMHTIASKSQIRPDWKLMYQNKYGKVNQVILSRWFLNVVFNQFNRSTYYLRKRFYDHIIFVTSVCRNYFQLLDNLPTSFLGIVPDLLDIPYCRKIFTNQKEKFASISHKAYLKYLRSSASTSFLQKIKDIDIEFLKNETLLYHNFCKLYFANQPELTPGLLQDKLYKRQKYLYKSIQISTL